MRSSGKLSAVLLALTAAGGCGYHVSGRGDEVPKTIHTVAVPPFTNLTTRYKLTDLLAEAVSRELIARTSYTVVPDMSQSDAVIKGAVINFVSYPVVADRINGRTSAVQVVVTMQVSMTERATGKIIFSRPTFDSRQRYEISVNPQVYFEESSVALQRLSQDVGRDIVSAILENF